MKCVLKLNDFVAHIFGNTDFIISYSLDIEKCNLKLHCVFYNSYKKLHRFENDWKVWRNIKWKIDRSKSYQKSPDNVFADKSQKLYTIKLRGNPKKCQNILHYWDQYVPTRLTFIQKMFIHLFNYIFFIIFLIDINDYII